MLNLALDTATPWGRFALAEGTALLAYRPLNIHGSYADALLPVIQELLDEAGRSREEVAGLGIVRGPGSFTGVRIGVATAKGLAYALGCELVAVSTLEAMAAALLAEYPEAEAAAPALDARRGEIFCGIFARAGGWVAPVAVPCAGTPDAWWGRVVAAGVPLEGTIFGGDGAELLVGQGESLRAELRGRGEPSLRRWTSAHPRTAAALAVAMGDPAAGLPRIHPFALVPEYMRVSDAEIKQRVDLTPLRPSGDVQAHRTERDDP
ncbi:MAG: tRNA (adenosine(37)-N6)-threonylcarbamoyltransferase complex dimerization subunit type 1 TsaB [bacterium]